MLIFAFISIMLLVLVAFFYEVLYVEIKHIGYNIFEFFYKPKLISQQIIPIQELEIHTDIWIAKRSNGTLCVNFWNLSQPCRWVKIGCVSFYIGKITGIIKDICIDYPVLKSNGSVFRKNQETDWTKYYTSIILAHIEVLKFSYPWYNGYNKNIIDLIKKHGDKIFSSIT